ncbi:hypothetical protein FRB90_007733 [Tulasnella sp. 427]|nr:hypothetical protein FRB90_007733 [Tulasnella sp. 427]
MDHRLLIINVTVFLTGIAATLAIVGYSFPRFDVVPTPKYVSGCWFTSGSFVFMAFIPPLVFELWLFVLVVFKLYRYIRESGGLSQRTFGRIILEDSANWFVMIAVLILWNALHLAFSPEGARGIALPYLRTFIIMGGCRLIIHMRREMFRHQYNQGSDSQISTTIEFRNVEVARAEDEDHRWNKARAITFAQQIGLPPASNNMALMWAESPEGSFDTESDDDGDIPLRHVTFGGHDNRESVVAP